MDKPQIQLQFRNNLKFTTMKITEKWLENNGYRKVQMEEHEEWVLIKNAQWSITLRKTENGEGFVAMVAKLSQKEFGKNWMDTTDTDARTFVGYVEDVEELNCAIIACGIQIGRDWQKRFPFRMVCKGAYYVVKRWDGEDSPESQVNEKEMTYNEAVEERDRLNEKYGI